MSGFKLIGLRANEGCEKKYSKILDKGKVYHFSQEYTVDSSTDKIILNSEKYIDLYSSNNLKININAIAGKNGTGKSTIMEMLFMIINNLSKTETTFSESLEHIKGLDTTLFFKTDQFYKLEIKDSDVRAYKYKKDLTLDNKPLPKFDFNDFFYSVAINYSQYSLNATQMGNWLNGLFHKNDGYQIPIVLNPMRTRGNFDINVENALVQARLFTNLVRENNNKNIDFNHLTDTLTATHVELKFQNKNKEDKVLYNLEIKTERNEDNNRLNLEKSKFEEIKLKDLNVSKKDLLITLNRCYNFKLFEYIPDDSNLEINYTGVNSLVLHSLNYLYYKVINIAIIYPEYQHYFNRDEKDFYPDKLYEYIKKLILEDTSHIVFKIKQTLNFLKYKHLEFSFGRFSLEDISGRISLVINDTSNNLTEENRIELLPPPIFKANIFLQSKQKGLENAIEFNTLSSGQMQMINSVSSILYHLINLDSVVDGYQYKRVNVLLDEIELYFHPELQRKYVASILNSVKALQFSKIKEINFCFITHSPFILSDIPSHNIMFLEQQNKEDGTLFSEQIESVDKTFCANIHDLLSKNFFMNNGFMGEFSVSKVKEIIAKLEHNIDSNVLINSKEIRKIIDIIGEPLLKYKLKELLEEVETNDRVVESNEDKIKRLEEELKKLKRQ
ncbi:AAA family ATPase [Tenacibaculum agarivorans]|uniref:AAA family ATPase n=1 Tax=Tenacibaculum agarivorans TaxID=1908389 RepID=UPI00094BAE7B|nr:AAA family ATPase [Tenacibaculum agarivorans]